MVWACLAEGEPPFYALMMFPYPSAEGLHVGNLFAFTGNDTTTLLQSNLSGYAGGSVQHYVGLRVAEHQKFIKAVFAAAGA